MGVVSFPSVSSGLSTEELSNLVARLIKEVEWTVNGNMDHANIRNISGFNVGPNQLKHSSGIVGMDGSNPTVATAVRFWSGDADPTIAPFRVTQAGIMTAIGGLFQSSSAYPRVEINSVNGLLAAYKDANNYVTIAPLVSSTAPGLNFHTGTIDAFMYLLGTALSIITPLGTANIELSSGRAIKLSADTTNGFSTQVDSWTAFRSTATARTLQQDLDGKAATFTGVNGTVYVSATSGGPATTAISFNNGVRTT